MDYYINICLERSVKSLCCKHTLVASMLLRVVHFCSLLFLVVLCCSFFEFVQISLSIFLPGVLVDLAAVGHLNIINNRGKHVPILVTLNICKTSPIEETFETGLFMIFDSLRSSLLFATIRRYSPLFGAIRRYSLLIAANRR